MPKIDANKLDLEERVIKTNKVQKTHKGGRTMSWNALVVVGDNAGHVGVGLGKARGVPDAIRKGVEDAKKQIVEVPLVGPTIPHEVLGRAGASRVMLRPAAPGTGVVAGGSVRAILEVAGVKDVLGKSLGSPNAINTAEATMDAFARLKEAEVVARLRGKTVEELLPKGILAAMAAAAPTIEAPEGAAAETPEPEKTVAERPVHKKPAAEKPVAVEEPSAEPVAAEAVEEEPAVVEEAVAEAAEETAPEAAEKLESEAAVVEDEQSA